MAGNESAAHAELKRLSLIWAQRNGFRVAAPEVSVPSLGASRLDVAAYRPGSAPGKDGTGRRVQVPALGTTAVFECKSSRADFLKDSRSERYLTSRLEKLCELRSLYESSMQQYFPTLRQGETLFPEFDVYRFEAAGFEPYDKIVAEMESLANRLHRQTKFDKLMRWKAANVHFLVVEENVLKAHELPHGWGLLVRSGDFLELRIKPLWQDASEASRWQLLMRIAFAGMRAVNQVHGIEGTCFDGLPPEAQKGVFQ